MKPALVIMAAGIGSRYGGLKQIDGVGPCGETVLEYSVYDAIRAGFGKVVFILRPEIEPQFREVVLSRLQGRIEAAVVHQTLDALPAGFSVPAGRGKPWGTGQAVLVAKPEVSGPFAVINADDFYGRGAFEVLGNRLSRTDPASAEFCMAGFEIGRTLSPHGGVARGWCDVREGLLHRIEERFDIRREPDGVIRHGDPSCRQEMADIDPVSMNIWGFTPRLFDFLEAGFIRFLERHGTELKSEYLLPELIDGLIRAGEATVRVLPVGEAWMGVTYAEDKPLVRAGIREQVDAGVYPECLWG